MTTLVSHPTPIVSCSEAERRSQRPVIPWTPFIPHKPHKKQLAFLLLNDYLEVGFGGSAGPGKVLSRDGVILTPFGFKKNTDLKVGDAVNNPDGTVSKIIQLHPWRTLERWRVHFQDGAFTDVAADHLWLAWRSGRLHKAAGEKLFGEDAAEVVETRKLESWLLKAQEQQRLGQRPNWPCVPVCQEQRFNVTSRRRSELDPYLLGAWLGDGHWSGSGIGFTSLDSEHTHEMLDGMDFYHDGKMAYRLRGESAVYVKHELKRLGLKRAKAEDKFVPREFLHGAIETRYAVLQGLLDTDGTVDKKGYVSFSSCSEQLAKDVQFLVNSLGGTATLTTKDPYYRDEDGDKVECQKAFMLYIKHRDNSRLFRLERKKIRCRGVQSMYRRVVKIEKGGILEGRCITVSHPNGLYLTNDFIVTHNSDALLMAALQFVDVPKYAAIIFRKTLSDLLQPNALLSRAMEWLSPWFPHVKYIPSEHSFRFPSSARLDFGYIGEFRSEERYQGAEYAFCGWDEATQHFEEDYLYLFSRLRRPQCPLHAGRNIDGVSAPLPADYRNCAACREFAPMEHIPLRMRSATNPGSIGHKWYKNRFNIVFDPVHKVWVGKHPERPFVPARHSDNPFINQAEYRKNLENLDPLTRAMLLDGDWAASQDARFKFQWACFYERKSGTRRSLYDSGDYFLLHKRSGEVKVWHSNALKVFMVCDFATSAREGIAGLVFQKNKQPSWTCFSIFAVTPDADLLWLDMDRFQGETPEILPRAKRLALFWRPSLCIGEMNGPGAPIVQLMSSMGLPMVPKFKVMDKIDNSTEAAVRMEQGKVFLPREADAPEMRKQIDDEVFTWIGHPHSTDDIVDNLSDAARQVVALCGNDYADSSLVTPGDGANTWETNVVMPVGLHGPVGFSRPF